MDPVRRSRLASPTDSVDPGAAALFDGLRWHLATLYRPGVADALRDWRSRGGEGDAAAAGLRPPLPAWLAERLDLRGAEDRARREIDVARSRGLQVLLSGGAGWPANLETLPRQPLALFLRGDFDAADHRAVAIVGTRQPTPYGVRQARRFAAGLAAAGVTVVSGLARGIDAEAHRGALDAGGRTIAVLGSGLGRMYPHEHRPLADAIVAAKRGCIVSELPWDARPLKHHFPLRNRIIAGLSLAVVVVEAGEKSGSLLTVDWSLDFGRQVFAVPGRVDDAQARGCLELLRSGAAPALDPGDVLEALFPGVAPARRERPRGREAAIDSGPRSEPVRGDGAPAAPAPPAAPLREPQRRLLELFHERGAWHPDAICERLGLEPASVLEELARGEIEGLWKRGLGGIFVNA